MKKATDAITTLGFYMCSETFEKCKKIINKMNPDETCKDGSCSQSDIKSATEGLIKELGLDDNPSREIIEVHIFETLSEVLKK